MRICAIICSRDRKDDLLRCIESLREQSAPCTAILVADNASSDGSADAVERLHGAAARVLRLPGNLGGAGGFNAGLRVALGGGFDAFLLLDSDVALHRDCVAALRDAMAGEPGLGAVGAKILRMAEPDRIQEFGPLLDTERVSFVLRYQGERDSLPLPGLLECDYVPACAMLLRREAVEAAGLLPEGNFLYYDDIAWCARARALGWKVAAASKARAWHKGGSGGSADTRAVYYTCRNRARFFLGYFPEGIPAGEEERQAIARHRAGRLLLDLAEGCHVCRRHGQEGAARTRMDAFLDALEGKEGQAEPWEIRPYGSAYAGRFREALAGEESVLLHLHGCREEARRVVEALERLGRERGKAFRVALADDAPGEPLLGLPVEKEPEGAFGLELHVCAHVYELGREEPDGRLYVDGWKNLLLDAGDFRDCRAFREGHERLRGYLENRVAAAVLREMGRQEAAGAGARQRTGQG